MAEERTRIERERVEKEELERAQAAERESRVRIRIEKEALLAAEERQRLMEEERRRRDEEARLEGIRVAEIERARNEVERRADLEKSAATREHEHALARIRQAASMRTAHMALAGTSAALALACAALLWLELAVNPGRIAELDAEYRDKLGSERARAERAERLLQGSEAARREAEARLRARETSPAPIATTTPTSRTPPRAPHGAKPNPATAQEPCLDEHDPLNPCLGKSRLR
jgi:hypothetical protein